MPGLLNHFDKGTRAAIENGQFQIVQFDDGIVDADPGKRREQVLGGGDEHALLHQTGGVADAGYVASAGFDGKTVEVRAMKNDSGSRRRGQDAQANRGAAVETLSCAGHSGANCSLVCQGRRLKSFVLYQLTGIDGFPYVAN
jgi:hypothetical protein